MRRNLKPEKSDIIKNHLKYKELGQMDFENSLLILSAFIKRHKIKYQLKEK